MTINRILPDQFETIDADLLFKDGATRRLRPVQSTTGQGDDIGVRSGDAKTGSNGNSGDYLLEVGAPDGTGKLGRVHVSSTILIFDSVDDTTIATPGATQIALEAGADGPHTEFFVNTPQGKIQVTKNGVLDVPVASSAAVDATRAIESLTHVVGGSGDPASGTVGLFNVLVYPAGASREARSQSVVPVDYRQGPGDLVGFQLKYTVGPGANPFVRITTYGGIENTSIGAVDYNLDVSGVTPGNLVTSPIFRTFSPSVAHRLDEMAIIIKRTTFVGEFTGDFKLVSVIFHYESLTISATISETAELFTSTDLAPPIPGFVGAFQSNDYPAGVVTESKCTFHIPQQFNPATDCFLRLTYAMSTAVLGARVDLSIEGSVNNTTALPPQGVSVFPANVANTITLTAPLRFINGLNPLDEILLEISRLATDTHTGSFRLISAELVMGSAIVAGAGSPEVDYDYTDIIPGAGPPNTDSITFLGIENEVYEAVSGLGDNQDATYVARCRVPTFLHSITFIRVTFKNSLAAGNNAIVVTVRRADGTVVYTSTPQVNASRTEFTISGASLLSSPIGGEHFLVLVQAIVDNGQTTYVASELTVGFN